MFLDDLHCLAAVRSFKYDGFSLQLFQDSVQRLPNQCVIVDNKNLHKKLSAIASHGDPIEKSYTHLRVFGDEEAGGRLAPENVHPPSLAQPAVRRQALKIGAERRCVL
jgi:hypothetical protein